MAGGAPSNSAAAKGTGSRRGGCLSPLPRLLLGSVVLLAITVLAYLPTARCGFIWDDDFYVTNNSTLRDSAGLGRIWLKPGATTQYYPLVHTTFWVEYHLWGLNPAGYHIVNVLLHGLAAMLAWRVARRLGVPGAWWVGAIFAVHPVHVESVAWIAERKNVLSGVLYLAAMLAFLRFRPVGVGEKVGSDVGGKEEEDAQPLGWLGFPEELHSRRWVWYAAALALFAGALLSKTVTCSLPAALLVLYWWKGRGNVRRVLPWVIPMFVLGAALAAVTVYVERQFIGAKGSDFDLSLLQRCLIAGRAPWFYLQKLLWPAGLTFIYPRWELDPTQWQQWMGPLALVWAFAALALMLRAGWTGRGPLAAAMLFVGTLAPALGFVNVYPMRYSFVADHFQYLASLAIIALAVGGAAGRWRVGGWGVGAGGAGGGVMLLFVLGRLTWLQCGIYQDGETLWRDTARKDPGSAIAWANLGEALVKHGGPEDPAAAAKAFRRSLEIRQDASVVNNLGTALEMMGPGQAAEAESYFRRAVELRPGNAVYRYDVGRFLVDHDHPREGAEELRKLLDDKPDYAAAWERLGVAELVLGQDDEGMECLQRAVRIDPNLGTAQTNLAAALLDKGLYVEAVPHAEQAVRLRPDVPMAHSVLRLALVMLGRGGELTAFYQRQASTQPAQPMIQLELGTCLAQAGQAGEAAEHLRKAVALHADWPEAMAELAMVLSAAPDAKVRSGDEAVRLARRACEMTERKAARPLDALAAALAEMGQFDQAADAARRAAGLAQAGGDTVLTARIGERLRLYEQRKAFRLPAGPPGPASLPGPP